MNKNRRQFLATAGALAATAATGQAQARDLIESLLNAPGRGNWDDQFDARAGNGKVASNLPIFSPETVGFIEQAIQRYVNIVNSGGWPVVPATKKLHLGAYDRSVETLRKRLMISGDLSPRAGISSAYDTYVDAAVKRFQARHGLPADGVMGRYSFAAMNVSAPIRLGQLETNLVRLRSMSGFLGERFVMVNIPAAQIEAVEGGRVVQRHTAIVGRTSRQTPILNSKINEVIINPYWNAPVSIVERDIIPLMRKDPTYLTRNSIRLYAPNGDEVDPATVDWSTDEAVNLRFRQDPGKINAMASVKINFPNPHAVYMHDTPQQSLFSQLLRFESSGCVRVQNVRDLVTWLLRDTDGWNRSRFEQTIKSGESVPVELSEPVPVYFTYISAWATSDAVVHFRDDIYRRDGVDELQISTAL
ncbi:MAG: L,D-transpeptidase family protein [Rhizobiaceae bacterium]